MNEKAKYLQLWQNAAKNTANAMNSGDMEMIEKYHLNFIEDFRL